MSALDHSASSSTSAHLPAAVGLPDASPSAVAAPASGDPEGRLERLGDRIAELSARLQATTWELLALIREFDQQNGWSGSLSCAQWLSWRTGLAPAAREHVRVAHALGEFPKLSDAMRRGRISYSKVRAVTRVATPENEQTLLDVALAGTAEHVERITRGWRRVDRSAERAEEQRRDASRSLRTWVDDDGMVVVRGRLTPEVGAVLRRALEAACDEARRAPAADGCAAAATADTAADTDERPTLAQRQADAIGVVADAALTGGLDKGTAGDRYQVVLHVDAAALAERRDVPAGTSGKTERNGRRRRTTGPCPGARPAPSAPAAPFACSQTVLDEAGGIHVSAETARRVACDAATVTMRHGPGGEILDVGRRTRTLSPALRRALSARDRQCRFPDCGNRRCDAHHIEHWADGGRRRSTTWFCSAGVTTARSTRRASASRSTPFGACSSCGRTGGRWQRRRRHPTGTVRRSTQRTTALRQRGSRSTRGRRHRPGKVSGWISTGRSACCGGLDASDPRNEAPLRRRARGRPAVAVGVHDDRRDDAAPVGVGSVSRRHAMPPGESRGALRGCLAEQPARLADQIQGQRQQAVAHRRSIRQLPDISQQARPVCVETKGEAGGFLTDELVQRPRGAGSDRLDLDRHDAASGGDDVVNLGGPPSSRSAA